PHRENIMRLLIGIAGLVVWGHALAQEAKPPSLALKAEVFTHDLEQRFLFDGQTACKRSLPTASIPFPFYNMPDNAYMTGMYLGSLCFQFRSDDTGNAREKARAALGALELLCTVSGKPGLLARAALPIDMEWHDDGIWR